MLREAIFFGSLLLVCVEEENKVTTRAKEQGSNVK